MSTQSLEKGEILAAFQVMEDDGGKDSSKFVDAV